MRVQHIRAFLERCYCLYCWVDDQLILPATTHKNTAAAHSTASCPCERVIVSISAFLCEVTRVHLWLVLISYSTGFILTISSFLKLLGILPRIYALRRYLHYSNSHTHITWECNYWERRLRAVCRVMPPKYANKAGLINGVAKRLSSIIITRVENSSQFSLFKRRILSTLDRNYTRILAYNSPQNAYNTLNVMKT